LDLESTKVLCLLLVILAMAWSTCEYGGVAKGLFVNMFRVESILNRVFRRTMTSFMKMEDVSGEVVQPFAHASGKDYLLYIHIPFCESLCPYCSFHRCEYEKALAESYFKALRREIRLYQEHGFQFSSVYIGGGTPTVQMDLLIDLLAGIKLDHSLQEISVETNPNHITRDHLSQMRDAGVTRLSVGVQSFDNTILHRIGRLEKYGTSEVIQEHLANAIGVIDTLNVDLIFNIPIQTDADLEHDLRVVQFLKPDQITFYPLMTAPSVERTLGQMLGPIDYRKEQRQFKQIIDGLSESYQPSTAWCFSRSKGAIDEYIVDHDQYVGVGSGSFGFFNQTLHINTFSLVNYIEKLNRNELPISQIKSFETREQQYYCLLRRLFGLKIERNGFIAELEAIGSGHLQWVLSGLKMGGALEESQGYLKLTPKGMYIWVMAMREFFIAVDTLRDQFRFLPNTLGSGGSIDVPGN
jgi:coproporphyrinogen III oxidase-like Fe-S oxidoreductase